MELASIGGYLPGKKMAVFAFCFLASVVDEPYLQEATDDERWYGNAVTLGVLEATGMGPWPGRMRQPAAARWRNGALNMAITVRQRILSWDSD